MSTHKMIQRTLLTAFVLSTTSLASAHVFRAPPTKAEVAAERIAACNKALKTGASAKRAPYRFGPPAVVTTGTGYRVAGPHRFGSEPHVAVVACTMPMRSHVACL
ncbi:MAG TPA: hypothetical protein VFZ53_22650 [Polyangiaceae bacterium]